MKASILSLLAIAATGTALDASSRSDADPRVWESLQNVTPRSNRPVSNRPFKRQDGWSPPSELTTPLQEVWQHCLDTYSNGLFDFYNYGWDQVMATQG